MVHKMTTEEEFCFSVNLHKMTAVENHCRNVLLSILCMLVHRSLSFRMVDLTYDLDKKGVTWPTNPKYRLTVMHRGPFPKHNVPWLENNRLELAEHTGTHMDAPAHFGKDKWRVHQIPIDRLRGAGVVINVKEKVNKNRDYRVNVNDVKMWEEKYGNIPNGAFVLLKTGWGKHYPNWNLVFGSQNLTDLTSFHFPSWHEDAIQWLVSNRRITGVGTDTPSLDYGPSFEYPAHLLISNNGLIGIESVAYIDNIPEAGAMIYASVMKIKEGSGAPIRLFATIGEESASGSSAFLASLSVTLMCLIGVTFVK